MVVKFNLKTRQENVSSFFEAFAFKVWKKLGDKIFIFAHIHTFLWTFVPSVHETVKTKIWLGKYC